MTSDTPKKTFTDESIRSIREQTIKGVGYGNPPEETKFKKGQSGNPKGRPKKSKTDVPLTDPTSVKNMILEESRRPVKVREGDKTFDISAVNAVIRAQYATAIKGSPIAQKNILEQVDRREREEAAEIAESNETWTAYKNHHWVMIETAKENGVPMPEPLPHPDDIVIEDGVWPRFTGPFNEDEARKADETCRFRDTLLMQDELDYREIDRGDDRMAGPGSAGVFAEVMNMSLPKRLQLDDKQSLVMTFRFGRMRQRDLLKSLYRAWRSLGAKLPRGYVFPPMKYSVGVLTTGTALYDAAKRGDIDPDAWVRGEPDEPTQAILATWPKK